MRSGDVCGCVVTPIKKVETRSLPMYSRCCAIVGAVEEVLGPKRNVPFYVYVCVCAGRCYVYYRLYVVSNKLSTLDK